jgi:hypothetical protein
MIKEQMIEALRRFINQRSGIEWGNYDCGDYKQSRECFLGDYRPILKHGKHARTLLQAVEYSDISAEELKDASRAYAGRLQFIEDGEDVRCDYTTGQYFPTEYRNAACAVLSMALWYHWRPDCKTGEAIQRKARKLFGRSIAATWFK